MRNIFGEEISKPKRTGSGVRTPKAKQSDKLGCEYCPLDKVSGINKVINIDRIKGKRIFVWAQTPGKTENAKKLELVGNAGQFLWEELRSFGIERVDCDTQNIVRCQPITSEDGNTPTKQEIKCCSIYNPQAIERNRGQAVVHLILGKIAGKQLLGKLYSKAKAAIWHEEWGAYVVCADHPSRILRSGGRKAGWLYYAFRDKLKAVKAIADNPGRWGYVNAQDYGAVTTPAEMAKLKAIIHKEASEGRNISVDIEDGTIDGKQVVLTIAFGWGEYIKRQWKGKARSVVLYHPEAPQTESRIDPLLAGLKEILEDPSIKKTMQHGSYDWLQTLELLGIRIRGYDFDTQYASYLWHPHLRTYGLDSLVGYFHMEFADYKQMVNEWSGNFANAPLDRLVRYNCADADLTKRIEAQCANKVNYALLQVYIHTAFVLDAMEERGPILDRVAHKKLASVIGSRVAKLRTDLMQAAAFAGLENYNPNTPAQTAKLLFDRLKLPQIAGRSTGKDILIELSAKSPVAGMQHEYRKVSKMESTYLVGFEKSADAHGGEIRTIWWLTGAATGRLRSGKSDKAEAEEGIINMQNLHGNPLLKNLLVSDKNWRIALG